MSHHGTYRTRAEGCSALTTSDISQYAWIIYLSYASAHAHDSSNHSYVSMNMDSVNDHELFSLLHPDIYRSFFDDSVFESTALLLELSISPSTDFLAESSPRPQNDPWHSDSTVAAPRPSLILC